GLPAPMTIAPKRPPTQRLRAAYADAKAAIAPVRANTAARSGAESVEARPHGTNPRTRSERTWSAVAGAPFGFDPAVAGAPLKAPAGVTRTRAWASSMA